MAVALGILAFGVFFLYAIWVTLIVAGQAISGQ
jgi:hypothetical protein